MQQRIQSKEKKAHNGGEQMKIKQIVPVTGDFLLDEETMAYNAKYLDPDTTVEVCQITEGQLSIESEFDEAINSAQVVKLCKEVGTADCDGIFVDCFGDPGVRGARECLDIPVFGGFEPAIHIGLGLGDKLGIVTVLKNVIPMIEGAVAKARLTERVVSIRSVDIPVADLEDKALLISHLTKESILSLIHILTSRLRRHECKASLIGVSVKSCSFFHYTHQIQLPFYTDDTTAIYQYACRLFRECWRKEPVRQIAITLCRRKSKELWNRALPDKTLSWRRSIPYWVSWWSR